MFSGPERALIGMAGVAITSWAGEGLATMSGRPEMAGMIKFAGVVINGGIIISLLHQLTKETFSLVGMFF